MIQIFLLLALVASPIAAQAPSASGGGQDRAAERAWSGSVGLSRVASPLGIGRHINVSRRVNGWSLRLSLDIAADLKETTTLTAPALSVGGHVTDGPLEVSLFVGPSLAWGRSGFDDAGFALEEPYQTVGVNVDLGVLFRVGPIARFGIAAWANRNSGVNAFGAGPRLQLGIR